MHVTTQLRHFGTLNRRAQRRGRQRGQRRRRRTGILGVNLHGIQHAQQARAPTRRIQELAGLGVEHRLGRFSAQLGGCFAQALAQRLTQGCGTLSRRRVGAGRLHRSGAGGIQPPLRAGTRLRRLTRGTLGLRDLARCLLNVLQRRIVALLKAGVAFNRALCLFAAFLQQFQGAFVSGAGGGGRLGQLHTVGAHALGGNGLHGAHARGGLAQGRHCLLAGGDLGVQAVLLLLMLRGRCTRRLQLFFQGFGAAGTFRFGGESLRLLSLQNTQLTSQKHRLQLADARLQLARGRGGFCLLTQRLQLRIQLGNQVAQAGNVRCHRLQLAAGLLLAAAVLDHARRLLNHVAALLRGGVQDRIQLSLADEHVHLLTQTRLREQVLNVGKARRGAVNLVLATAGAEHGARNLHPISGNAEGAIRIIESQGDFGAAQGCTLGAVTRTNLAGAREDNVLHAAAAQALSALLAHNPGERIQHIGLAGAVGADHRVNAGGELKSGCGGERLEPAQGQRHQVHKGPFCRRTGVCRARSVVRGGIPLVYAVRRAGGVNVHGVKGVQSSSFCIILRAG